MRRIVSTLGVFAVIAGCAGHDATSPSSTDSGDSPGLLSDLGGHWTGTIEQPGFQNYAIKVDVNGGAPLYSVFATVAYPDQSCTGEWTAVSRTTGTQYHVLEHITSQPAPATCIADVDIELTYTASPRRLGVAIFVQGAIVADGLLQPDAAQ